MAADANKVQVVIFLLYASIFLLGMNGAAIQVKACPLYCLDVEYMTCNGTTVDPPRCNCCLAPKGCILHLSDGNSVHCG
ncbi:proteinase inhibitor PSI-1.2 [Primulina eburnea]|uniref:proteinase inhibitor PSI-1.2 n=1 Tax=Primulina eburnea TaxID=1245227 RepID=UPI003C6C0114